MPDVNNIASVSISVFPTVNRTVEVFNRSQRLFTEQNVRDIANMVNSKDSYVIEEKDGELEFCLGGYHVIVLTSAIKNAINDGDVYAVAQFQDGNLDMDDAGVYKGISFDSSKPEGGTYLLLGTKDGDTFTIAKESKIMYDGERVDAASLDAASIQSINLTLIDGGEA